MPLSSLRRSFLFSMLAALAWWLSALTLQAAPAITALTVQPAALEVGKPFTVAVTASAEVIQGTATVDFRPWASRVMRVTLAKQGGQWTGTGTVPADLAPPAGAKATITAVVVDAARASATASITPSVQPPAATVITAVFSGGILTVTGTPQSDAIVVGRDAAGNLRVNGGAVPIGGGTPTVANTSRVRIFGLAGDDALELERTELLPPGEINGEGGNDHLKGGRGVDVLSGGPGTDHLDGGPGNDIALGGEGDDEFVWNPGDGSDVVEGQGGSDALLFNGSNANETFSLTPNGARFSLFRNVGAILMDCAGLEQVVLNALGGEDIVDASALPASAGVRLTLNGGPGNDLLLGGGSADLLTGGDGADTLFGGGGDDLFPWAPGDDSDVIEGQGGYDGLLFMASNASETIDVSANGARVVVFRNVANVTLDANDVEELDIRLLGGTDILTVNDLAGTDLVAVRADLSASGNGGGGDGVGDSVVVRGSAGDDVMMASGNAAAGVTVVTGALTVAATGIEASLDTLRLDAGGGADVVDSSALEAGVVAFTATGGLGADIFIGGPASETFIGGDGNDTLFAGAGDDIVAWSPGDDNDIIEGQGGYDSLLFMASNASETIDVVANGGRVVLFRNVANVVLDANDVEEFDLRLLGGADLVIVNNLAGTDVLAVRLDLSNGAGAGDGALDSVIVNGTNDDDVILATGTAGTGATVAGLAAVVAITGAEAANDRLRLNALGGDDVVEASALKAGVIGLTASGGEGHDVLIGSEGDDTLLGDAGDDVLLGGLGLDVLDGGPGDDIEIQ